MLTRLISCFAAAMLAGTAQAAPDPTVAHADYADAQLWLCRPDKATDACRVNLDATVIAPSGKTTLERFRPAKSPKVDCFFVYPTVSRDPGVQSDFVPDNMETDDIQLQFARFGAVCRTFAPIYRQFTLTALRAASTGAAAPAGPRPAPGVGGYADVLDAWTWYLAHENKGRGVVLIGHSQGASLITRLLADTVDGKPLQKQLVSALVIGSPNPFLVAPGRDVDGTLETIPLCHAEDQTGCVIAYASFRDTIPPPANSLFGKAPGEGQIAACANPANLAGGKGDLHAYLGNSAAISGQAMPKTVWVKGKANPTTPFISAPGLLSAQCVEKNGFSYLEVQVNGLAADPRTDTIEGDVIGADGQPNASWGLHLIDAHLAMGNLVDIVGAESKAWLAKK